MFSRSLTVLGLAVLVFFNGLVFASEAVEGAKKDVDAFKKEMNAKLEQTEKDIKKLKAKAAGKSDEVRNKAIRELESARDTLKSEIEDTKGEAKTNWTKFKSSVAKSMDELNAKIQSKLKD